MPLTLSRFGARFTRSTGALELMDDLGSVLAGDAEALMLGGGNPAKIPEVQARFRARLAEVAASPREFDRLLADYAHPKGELTLRQSLAKLLKREYGWRLTEDNIALTAGSQAAFFLLFNLLAGEQPDGSRRRVLLPVTPEYVGYADVGLADGLFRSLRPTIEELAPPFFKYRLNLAELDLDADIAAICVSRPTNPTGNVLTDDEMAALDALAQQSGVPLIVDNAYGMPFPNIVFRDATPSWNANTILCLSLSKLGLPGARTGIVVASEEVIDALTRVTAVLNLAVGSVGPVLVQPLVESGEIIELSRRFITPYYRAKAAFACEELRRELTGVPYQIHSPEGAFFLWLWFPGLPIKSAELYGRLKKAGVFVLSGHYFFPGLEEPWAHVDECIRVSFAEAEPIVREGIRRIGAEVRSVFASG
jgi:valine--pyruvate aminotransferase